MFDQLVLKETRAKKGQIVIPSKVRRKLGIIAGARIRVEPDEKNGSMILEPVTRECIHSLSGRLRGAGLLDELRAERKRELEKREDEIELIRL